MIVIKVELWPLGDRRRARELARMAIWNRGVARGELYSYGVAIAKAASHGAKSHGVWRSGTVEYPRGSKRVGVWDLLRAGLNAVLVGRPQFKGSGRAPTPRGAAGKVVKKIMELPA